ncbi:MAG: hypothetical protein K0Q99_831 [Clostridia bacterium]|jgi:hypothetical protein|nr:hypothetical protein [Clostridia bacterium]
MEKKTIKIIIIIAAIVILTLNGAIIEKKREGNVYSLPSLPKPIAKEYVLITSAGQSTDAYIVNDIANKLMIHNYFMPQAKENNLESVNTLVFVVGYSELGEKLHGTSYEDEKKRIVKLLEKSVEENLVVITIYIGGKQQLEENTKGLLSLIIPNTDYLIGTKEANGDGFLSDQAKNNKISFTLINGVNDLSEPFASAFR